MTRLSQDEEIRAHALDAAVILLAGVFSGSRTVAMGLLAVNLGETATRLANEFVTYIAEGES